MSIKVVDAKVIRVSTALYRATRSFLESSLKDKYLWNTGIHLLDKVIFEKTGKWRLVISSAENKMEALLEAPNSSCIKYYDSSVVEVIDAVSFLRIDAREAPLELERTFLAPDKDMPFAGPIRVADIVAKMELYLMAAKNHLDECALVHEEAEAKEEAEAE
jgi:hypothetical protein